MSGLLAEGLIQPLYEIHKKEPRVRGGAGLKKGYLDIRNNNFRIRPFDHFQQPLAGCI